MGRNRIHAVPLGSSRVAMMAGNYNLYSTTVLIVVGVLGMVLCGQSSVFRWSLQKDNFNFNL
jgi:hypothetical protein